MVHKDDGRQVRAGPEAGLQPSALLFTEPTMAMGFAVHILFFLKIVFSELGSFWRYQTISRRYELNTILYMSY